jgi:hypothetical protein
MIMISNKNIEFDDLFYKVAINNFSLEYLKEVELFYPKFSGRDNFDEIKFNCENLLSAIYFMNNMDEKSLHIDLDLLQSSSPYLNDYTVILRAIKTSEELGRKMEVVPYANIFLKDKQDNWSCKLPLLSWYTKVYLNDESGSFSSFETLLSSIAERMGVKVDNSLFFVDRVEYLYKEFRRGSNDLHALQVAYAKAPIAQKEALINDYLLTERVEFYRNQVKNSILP